MSLRNNFTNNSQSALANANVDSVWGISFFYSVIFVCGLSNLIIVVALLKTIRMKKRNDSSCYLFNLCVSDGLIVACIPFRLIIYAEGKWLFGPIICSLWLGTQNICSLASAIFVALITFDRYAAVCHRSGTKFTRKFVFISSTTVLAWLAAVSLTLPHLIGVNTYRPQQNTNGDVPRCFYHPIPKTNYLKLSITYSIRFIFPLTFVVGFSIMALVELCRLMSRNMPRGRSYRSYRRVAFVLLIGLASQTAFWAPHHIAMLSGYAVNKWLLALSFFSSAVNPFIYGFVNKNLWDSLRRTVQLRRHVETTQL